MKDLFDEIRNAISCKLYYSALFLTVTVPDICAALQSENNKTAKNKYENWCKKHLTKINFEMYGEEGQLNAENLYLIRCSLLHQGQTNNQKDYKRMLFIEPETDGYNRFKINRSFTAGSDHPEKSLVIDIVQFCENVIKAGEEWLKEMETNEYYVINAEKLIKRHPHGISPVYGIPLIG